MSSATDNDGRCFCKLDLQDFQALHNDFFFYRIAGATGRKKVFRLSDVVQPLAEAQLEKLTSKTVKRILHSEKAIAQSGMSHVGDTFFIFLK